METILDVRRERRRWGEVRSGLHCTKVHVGGTKNKDKMEGEDRMRFGEEGRVSRVSKKERRRGTD